MVRLLPEYIQEIAGAEAKKAELESSLEAMKKDDDGEESEELDFEEIYEEGLTELEIKELKKELAAARKSLNALKIDLIKRLEQASSALTAEQCQQLVLDIARSDLAVQLDRYISAHRQQVIAAVLNWWDKYHITLLDIERERDSAAQKLSEYVRVLGYVR